MSEYKALTLIDNLISYIEQAQKGSFSVTTSIKNKSSINMPSKVEQKTTEVEENLGSNIYGNGAMPLSKVDPDIYKLIKDEEERQRDGLELIASENFTSMAVMQAVGSCLTNKYSEGLPGKRYYGGNEVIDKLESLCQKRALIAFGLNSHEWSVNVQPYSGSVGNFAAFSALLEPNDRFMGLYLPDGGHLSHGFYRGHKSINISSKYFQSLPYFVDVKTGYIDYDELEKNALIFCPKLIVGGSSAYPRDWDYKRLRLIADKVKAKLLIDMAHYSGLVAAKVVNNPFEYADVVTTTTHKSLRSTRACMIFCKKELEKDMNSSVFPGCQGGPHNHAIAGIAVALREAHTSEYRDYCKRVCINIKACANELMKLGHKIVTDGTDTHLFLWDLRPHGVGGSRIEYVCDLAHITVNKNTVHGDKSALNPGGVRIGSPALTSRGFKEDDFRKVAQFLHETCQLSIEIQKKSGPKKAEFIKVADKHEGILELREKVRKFASQFPMPGLTLK